MYEVKGYIERNAGMIGNYGPYYRDKRPISTAFDESLVNYFLSKRFTKKQQMQWTKRGAHQLLQRRAKVINDKLEMMFRHWYPDFRLEREAA